MITLSSSVSFRMLLCAALLWPVQDASATDAVLDAIRAAIQHYALAHAPTADARVDIATVDARLRLTPCAAPLDVTAPTPALQAGRNTVNVRCSTPRPWQVYVPVLVTASILVAVAARPLVAGHVISASDIKLEKRDLAQLRVGYITDLVTLVGQQTRQNMAVGTAIHYRTLTPALRVHRGTPVTLLIGLEAFEIRVSGVAMDDGSEGAIVRVRNDSSKKIVRGQVIGKDVVRVSM